MGRPLAHDREQRMFADSVAAASSTLAAPRPGDRPPTADEAAAPWAALCRQLGAVGLPLPERHGGTGAGWTEVGIVLERAGHDLLTLPYLSAMTAVRALAPFEHDPYVAKLLAATIDGAAPPVLAVPASTFAGVKTVRPHLHDDVISATLPDVLDAPLAGSFVCAADADGEPALVLVDAADAGLDAALLLDLTRGVATVRLERAPARVVAAGATAEAAMRDALTFAAVAVAVEAVGGAARCLELTVDYAKVRHQFGAPIGRQQAVKHSLADIVRAIEPARAAAYAALAAVDAGSVSAHVGALAKTSAVDAYLAAAGAAIQLHGAIGFTWEHEAHRHLERAVCSGALFGRRREHRRALAQRMLRELADPTATSA